MQELTPGNTQTFTEARASVTNTRMTLRGWSLVGAEKSSRFHSRHLIDFIQFQTEGGGEERENKSDPNCRSG